MNHIVKKIITVGTGGALAQVVTALSMPLLTRLYSPNAYAGWALFFSAGMIFTTISTLRYELAVVLPKKNDEAINVMMVCFIVSLCMSALSAILIPFVGELLYGEKFYKDLSFTLWLIPPYILFFACFQTACSWFTRAEEFRWYAISQSSLPLFTVLSQFLFALAGYTSALGLIGGTLVGQILSSCLVTWVMLKKCGRQALTAISFRAVWDALVKFKNYPLFMTPYTLVGTLRDRVVYFFLGNYGGQSGAGFYSMAARLINLPNSFISSAVRPVFFQKAARVEFKSLENVITRTIKALIIAVVPFWVLFLFHSKILFALVFGEAWGEAGIYGAILSVPAIPLILGNWMDRSFDVLGKQRLAFTLELIFSLLSIAAISTGIIIFQNTLLAISMQAAVLTIYYSYWIVALFRAAEFSRSGLSGIFLWFVIVCAVSFVLSLISASIFTGISAIALNLVLAICSVGFVIFRNKQEYINYIQG